MSSLACDTGRLTFICGGVRSGKSRFGEEMAASLKYEEGRLIYIATARKTDAEMEERIKKHQRDRTEKEESWVTIERTDDLKRCAEMVKQHDIVFIDCLTTWLSNEMFRKDGKSYPLEIVKARIQEAILSIMVSCSHLVIISNDIFQEPILKDTTIHRYIKGLGELHQFLVERSDQAIMMESGIPIMMKGGKRNERNYRMGNDL